MAECLGCMAGRLQQTMEKRQREECFALISPFAEEQRVALVAETEVEAEAPADVEAETAARL